VKTLLTILAALVVLAPSVSPDEANQEMCLCEFVAPTYELVAHFARIQGVVRVEFGLDADGVPEDPKVLESAHALLSELALNAIKGWRFCPSSVRPDQGRMAITFRFKLEGEAPGWAPTKVVFDGSQALVEVTTPMTTATLQR